MAMTNESATIEALRITGSVGTGKTHRLMHRALELASAGTTPKSVLILCATPQAAQAFSNRMQHAGIKELANINITTPRAFALSLLGDEQAIRWSGREPRLLSAFEETFLLEDMKVCGLRPKRLREMLKFFYRSWTELADDDPAWLLPGEEADVHTLLKANLAFVRGMVEPEIANLAVRYLQAHEDARATHTHEHVLVDDYQCLSRASQTLANLIATHSLTIACDENACVEVYDSYPYGGGIAEFMELHPNATNEVLAVSHRSLASARCARALLNDPSMTTATLESDPYGPADEATVFSSAHPADEFDSIVRTVADAVANGTPANTIAVAVPNNTWSRTIAATLRAQGLPVDALPDSQPVRGDIRDNARCIPARILTALNLVANPNDAVSWRCWCGFGDYLVNSSAIANLRTFAEKQGIGLVEALEMAASGGATMGDNGSDHVVGAQRVIAAYQTGRTLIERTQGLTGEHLLDELARIASDDTEDSAPAVIRTLCLGFGDSSQTSSAAISIVGLSGAANKSGTTDDAHQAQQADTAASMAQRATQRLLAPILECEEAIAVVPYDLLCGLSPDLLVVAGFVNGFIPCRDYFDGTATPLDKQEKMHATDTRRVYSMVGKANKQLAISYFTSTDLETAGKLKLKINRIRLEEGMRMCAIAPSEFLAKMTEER